MTTCVTFKRHSVFSECRFLFMLVIYLTLANMSCALRVAI